jgi:hypothetical protein
MVLFESELQKFITHVRGSKEHSRISVKSSECSSMELAVSSYQRFIDDERQDGHLESRLKQACDTWQLDHVDTYDYVGVNMYQKLPRVVQKDLGLTFVKKTFANEMQLKKNLLAKAVFSLYQNVQSTNDSLIVIFAFVLCDGLGDYIAAKETQKILLQQHVNVQLILILPDSFKEERLIDDQALCHYYNTKESAHFQFFSKKIIETLRQSDCVLQIPTMYPYWRRMIDVLSLKSFFSLAEYGFVDTTWAHPKSVNVLSMGLHFLEKGIFIKKASSQKPSASSLADQLFKSKSISQYKNDVRMVFSYLKTKEGAAVFLHLLLTYFYHEDKEIHLVTPDASDILFLIDSLALDFQSLGLKEIHVCCNEEYKAISISRKGKVLRVIQLSNLSSSDTLHLFSLSHDLVACRGNQSFSESVSVDAIFFYDATIHNQPFLRDLYDIAKKALFDFPSVQEFIKGSITKLSITSDWSACKELGIHLAFLLKDGKTKQGLLKLNELLRKQYSINKMLTHLCIRQVLHARQGEIKKLEQQMVDRLIKKGDTFVAASKHLSYVLMGQ